MSDIPPQPLPPNERASNQLNSPPLIGQADFIPADIVCSKCGYNLRGQARDGRCSECGTPVMDAFRRGMLIYADRNWLIRVRSGVVLFFWVAVAAILLGVTGMIALTWYMFHHARSKPPDLPSWFQIPSTILSIAGTVFAMVIVYRLTAPEPQPGDTNPPARSGRTLTIVRLAWLSVAIQAINLPVYLMLGSPDFVANTLPLSWAIFTAIGGGISSLVLMINALLLLVHLRSIARRDRTPALGKLFTLIIWGGPVNFTLMAAGGIAMMLLSGTVVQSATSRSILATTQVGSVTVSTTIKSPTLSGPVSSMPTSAPVAHHAAPSPMLFVLMPILAVSECLGFIVFIIGIIATVQFYRALTQAITHNVGMASAIVVNPPRDGNTNVFG